MNKYKINANYANTFKNFILNIKDFFYQNHNTIHKARNELKVIPYNEIDTVVKSFRIPNILNQIIYSFFRNSKAKKSYEYSLKIGDFTPEPIGYIEFYSFMLLKESYFVSQKFDYDFTIREPLLDNNFSDREAIFRAFAKFTLELHNNNIFHNDYSPGNILIKKDVNGYLFKIVDINRMKFFNLTLQDRAKNFSKLWASDEILTTMAKEYQLHYACHKSFITQVLYFSNKNKKIKNFKKRLKGEVVND
jgi:serine/threonine protein kinase